MNTGDRAPRDGRLPFTAADIESRAARVRRGTADFVHRSASSHRESERTLRRIAERLGLDAGALRLEPLAGDAGRPAPPRAV